MDVKIVGSESLKAVNLCESIPPAEDMVINYTYIDQGRQLIILDIGVLVSIAGVSWMTEYLDEFDLTIDKMKSVECQQPFRFGPSKKYVSKTLIELPVLIT